MPSVTYDDRSYMLDGKRIWLVSGTIHYFRIPAGQWRDRLLKAKRGGLNCIETYIAWNFHEMQEGQWNFSGDRDIVSFIKLAKELGLYVILRPGPYICAEWDFGGLPAYLTTKSGIAYRTNNATFSHYFDKYFRQVLPRLAEHQVTRGGNIIFIQNENEYMMTAMPDRLAYLEFITQLIRRSGFDIPIINCNIYSDPPLPDSIEFMNGWGDEIEQCKRMRLRQPNAPLMYSEFWMGWFDAWGKPHNTRSPAEVARRAMEILGSGSQNNYYVWHGGTNFGFWSSRLSHGDDQYQTTSYDYDAAIAEGGGLSEKYYLCKLVNMLANHMGRYFASCTMGRPGVDIHSGTDVLNISGPEGGWATVTTNGRSELTVAEISLPTGMHLTVPLQPIGAAVVPVNLKLTAEAVVDWCNLTPLGFFSDKYLLLHGPAGFDVNLSINGQKLNEKVPESNEPKFVDHQGLTIVLLNSHLASRSWVLEQSIVFGGDYVGASEDSIVASTGMTSYTTLNLESGKVAPVKFKPASAKTAALAALEWNRICVCNEPTAEKLAWEKMAGPVDADRLGVHYGYLWYRVQMESDKVVKRNLFLPQCEDRATLYLNGELVGTWGRGAGAVREPLAASFRKGTNTLTALLDNMGRCNFSYRLGSDMKGLYGHVYDAVALETRKFRIKPEQDFNKRMVPRQLLQFIPQMQALPLQAAELDVTLNKVLPTHLSFRDLPLPFMAVFCNEKLVGFFQTQVNNYGDITLSSELRKGKNVIRLLLWGQLDPRELEKIRLHTLETNLSEQARWSYRRWQVPCTPGPVVGKNQPAWYVAKFKRPQIAQPLFLHLTGAKKGQVFLNGQNIGRYWSIGPQENYYLPESWLKEQNELMLFDEQGALPAKSRLIVCPSGQYHNS